jgi:hypothetical protein
MNPLDLSGFCPDCAREHVCGYCHDTGVLLSARVEVHVATFTVNPCPDCLASEGVPSEVFGIWGDLMPRHVRDYLEIVP